MNHQIQSIELNAAVKLLAENGSEGMADAIEILVNEAIKLERTQYHGGNVPVVAKTESRSHANGFRYLGKLDTPYPESFKKMPIGLVLAL